MLGVVDALVTSVCLVACACDCSFCCFPIVACFFLLFVVCCCMWILYVAGCLFTESVSWGSCLLILGYLSGCLVLLLLGYCGPSLVVCLFGWMFWHLVGLLVCLHVCQLVRLLASSLVMLVACLLFTCCCVLMCFDISQVDSRRF